MTFGAIGGVGLGASAGVSANQHVEQTKPNDVYYGSGFNSQVNAGGNFASHMQNTGSIGSLCSQWAQGVCGSDGSKGSSSSWGAEGSKGSDGSKGSSGSWGAEGSKGSDGSKGSGSVDGSKGSDGS
ncbi:MAG: hypothetical protein WAS34_06125 [Thiolinea sp.]